VGWLFGWDTRKELVEHLLAQKGGNCKAIKSCSVGNNLWVVFEAKEPAQTPQRFVCLFLIKGGAGRDGWGYKDVDETAGPCEINCPASYLDLAQPEPTEGYAVEWRQRVRARAAKLKAAVPGARFINPHKAELPVYEVTKRRSPSSWLIKDAADGHRYRAGPKFMSSLELLT
jgi:hypothetical protein